MTLYEIGESEEALKILRAKVLACEGSESPACAPTERAALFMCIGIILSAGQSNHNAGVQAFKKALAIDPQMRLAPEYSTDPASKAFFEARWGQTHTQTTAQAPVVQSAPPAQATPLPSQAPAKSKNDDATHDDVDVDVDDDEPKAEFDPDKKRMYWLATGTAHYGLGGGAPAFGQIGGALGFAGMPSETSGFTIGARIRSGALFADETLGFIGPQMLVGSTWGPRKNSQFTFLLGGMGFENYFNENGSSITGHLLIGKSLGGLILAGGVNVALGSISYAVFGLEIGIGSLL